MNDDLISRQAALDMLMDMYCKSDEDGYVWIIRSDAWKRIDLLPSVQPERKEGQWFFETLDGVPGYRPTVMFCSKCGRVSIADYSYCPNCGAKMGGLEG